MQRTEIVPLAIAATLAVVVALQVASLALRPPPQGVGSTGQAAVEPAPALGHWGVP